MYTINTPLPHLSIQSSHGLPFLYEEEINPIALEVYLKFGIHADLRKTDLREKVVEMSKVYDVAQSASNGSMVNLIQSCFNFSKHKNYITITPKELARKRTRCLKSVLMHLHNMEALGLYYVEVIVSKKGEKLFKIYHAETSPLHPNFQAFLNRLKNLDKKEVLEIFSNLKTRKPLLEEGYKGVENLHTIIEEEKDKSFSMRADKGFTSSCQEKIEKNKNVKEISEEEKKVASESETSSATSEQPQDPIAMKLTECEATPEPLSETPPQTATAKQVNKEKDQENQKKSQSFQKARRDQKKREEARKHGYRKLRKPEIEDMIQQAWVYFVSLFQPEGSALSWVCSELDFKTCLSAKIPRLFYGIEGFKKYLDAIFTNEHLMGRRRMSNGNFWVLQLGAMLSEKVYDQYLSQSGLFKPSNYIVFAKKEEASVPQNLLEKLNFSSEQLETVCEVINDHLQQTRRIVNEPLQRLEAQLVDKSASPLTTQQLEKLMMDRPVKNTPTPSESREKEEKAHEVSKTTQYEEKLLGDVSSPFDEAVKNHLLQVLPYNTYKAWMIDAKASFEGAEFGWKMTANRQFSKNQIETKFGQFIDEACRNYMKEKEDKMSHGA